MRIVDETHLRERLLLLPKEEFGDLARELDALLAQAAEAEASGLILSEFAERLRDDFATPRSVRFAADDNAIQLITSQKAKGSEWQCVIIPFLARELRLPTPPYPHFVKSPATGELLLALGKEDKPKELKDAIERAQAQELERLLYVATTRARHTLVLPLDQEIFSNIKGELLKTAQLRRLLRDKDVYAGEFDECASAINDGGESKSIAAAPEKIQSKIEPLPSRELKRAVHRASEFVSRITPSAFDADISETPLPRSRLDNPATLYGRWWHQLLQRLPWKEEDAWDAMFQAALSTRPTAPALKNRWKLFCAHISGTEDFRKRFAADELLTRTEIPFLLKIKPSLALEGIIDLALIDSQKKTALIIDWKTNRISSAEIEKLRARYRSQIAAYWKAMMQITGYKVEAGLYSTATGLTSFYQIDELEQEWRRLETLPPEVAEQEVSIP